jgi:hypothetical protein
MTTAETKARGQDFPLPSSWCKTPLYMKAVYVSHSVEGLRYCDGQEMIRIRQLPEAPRHIG